MPPANSIEARVEFYYDGSNAASAEQTRPTNFGITMAKKWNSELEHFIDKKNVAQCRKLSKIVKPDRYSGDEAPQNLCARAADPQSEAWKMTRR